MVRNISSAILALAILVVGYFAQKKLNLWERSIMIFKVNSTEQQFLRGIGRGSGGFAGREGFGLGQGRGFPEEGMRQRGGFERGGFNPGKKVNLNRSAWYLAIFASFTEIVIDIERGVELVRGKYIKSAKNLQSAIQRL